MINVWDTLSVRTHLPRMFLSTDYIYEKKTDCTSFPWPTYYTKDNPQGCSRVSNWFSLWRLGPRMNHLTPYDGPLLDLGLYLSVGVNFLLISCLYSFVMHCLLFSLLNLLTLK